MTGGPRGDHAIPPARDHSTIGQNPSVGRIVHYVGSYGECLAALVTQVISVIPDGAADLTVFPPGGDPLTGLLSIRHDEDRGTGSWHWPERA